MAKFNVVQKKRRAAIADKKRLIHGDPTTGKLHQRIQPKSISGKRQRKLLKKWRRVCIFIGMRILCISEFVCVYLTCCLWRLKNKQEQKDAVEKGLITMEDVEMAVADGMSFAILAFNCCIWVIFVFT